MNTNKFKRAKTLKTQKKEFTQQTRVYDLVKAEYHSELKKLVNHISPFDKNGSSIDWKHLRCFQFDESQTSKTEYIFKIAQFLYDIGQGDGLKCRMSVFIRYLSTNEHSNFCLKYRTLNTLIYRMLRYIEAQKNDRKVVALNCVFLVMFCKNPV